MATLLLSSANRFISSFRLDPPEQPTRGLRVSKYGQNMEIMPQGSFAFVLLSLYTWSLPSAFFSPES